MEKRDGRTDGIWVILLAAPNRHVSSLEGYRVTHLLADIKSVSFGGYLETELSQHNPVRKQFGHPVLPSLNRAKRKEKDDNDVENE